MNPKEVESKKVQIFLNETTPVLKGQGRTPSVARRRANRAHAAFPDLSWTPGFTVPAVRQNAPFLGGKMPLCRAGGAPVWSRSGCHSHRTSYPLGGKHGRQKPKEHELGKGFPGTWAQSRLKKGTETAQSVPLTLPQSMMDHRSPEIPCQGPV